MYCAFSSAPSPLFLVPCSFLSQLPRCVVAGVREMSPEMRAYGGTQYVHHLSAKTLGCMLGGHGADLQPRVWEPLVSESLSSPVGRTSGQPDMSVFICRLESTLPTSLVTRETATSPMSWDYAHNSGD